MFLGGSRGRRAWDCWPCHQLGQPPSRLDLLVIRPAGPKPSKTPLTRMEYGVYRLTPLPAAPRSRRTAVFGRPGSTAAAPTWIAAKARTVWAGAGTAAACGRVYTALDLPSAILEVAVHKGFKGADTRIHRADIRPCDGPDDPRFHSVHKQRTSEPQLAGARPHGAGRKGLWRCAAARSSVC